MSRTSANAKLLLRQDAVVRLLLEACDRYRGQNATAVVDASCRALLYLAMDSRGAAALEMQHSHAVDILLRLSESSSVDEVTRLFEAGELDKAVTLKKQSIDAMDRLLVKLQIQVVVVEIYLPVDLLR